MKALSTDGKSLSCTVHSAYLGLVKDTIKMALASTVSWTLRRICCCEHQSTATASKKSKTTCHDEDDQLVAWDDVTGAMLDLELVQESRKAEIVYFKKIDVCEKVQISECTRKLAKLPWACGGFM